MLRIESEMSAPSRFPFSSLTLLEIKWISLWIIVLAWHHHCYHWDTYFFNIYCLAWSTISGSVSMLQLILRLVGFTYRGKVNRSYSQRELTITGIQTQVLTVATLGLRMPLSYPTIALKTHVCIRVSLPTSCAHDKLRNLWIRSLRDKPISGFVCRRTTLIKAAFARSSDRVGAYHSLGWSIDNNIYIRC